MNTHSGAEGSVLSLKALFRFYCRLKSRLVVVAKPSLTLSTCVMYDSRAGIDLERKRERERSYTP
jgi:hypothetical protein